MSHSDFRARTGGRTLGLATAVAALLTTPAVFADETPNVLDDSFNISLGTFVLNSDTNIRVDGDTERGTDVNWEDEFGGGDLSRFRVDGFWRFGDTDRHKLRFMWFNSSRSKSKTLERDIEFDGQTYPVSAKVESEFNFDIYELAYEYAFLRKDTWELTGTFGLHYADLSAKLAVKGANGAIDRDTQKEASVAAPLPVIGLRGLWALPHNLWIDASAQFFALSIDQYDGNVQDYKVVFGWQPKSWLGVGVGYNRFGVNVDVDTDKFGGSLDWTYSGPMLFYNASF